MSQIKLYRVVMPRVIDTRSRLSLDVTATRKGTFAMNGYFRGGPGEET